MDVKTPEPPERPTRKANIPPRQEKPLNIRFIQEKLVTGFSYTKQAKDQDLILLLGNSGVGKSTTGNYLLNPHNMEEKEISTDLQEGGVGSIFVIDTKNPAFLPIGHNVESETLYANPVKSETFDWCLTDCPGFLGNRSIEERIIESISTELAIRHARQVKGIIVLISMESIKETRLFELLALVKALVTLFKNPAEMVEHTVFGITKAEGSEDRNKKTVLFKLSQLIGLCDKKINELGDESGKDPSGLEALDYEHIKAYFSAVLKKQDKILFINPLDGGVSRQQLIVQINGIKPREGLWGTTVHALKLNKAKSYFLDSESNINPITIDDFNFSSYDPYRGKFNQAMYEIAYEGLEQIKQMFICVQDLTLALSEYDNNKKHIDGLNNLKNVLTATEDQQKNAEKRSAAEKKTERSIENWQKTIQRNNSTIQKNKKRQKQHNSRINEWQEELNTINNGEPIIFSELHQEKKTGLLFGTRCQFDFLADTNDKTIPLTVKKSKENGEWEDEEDRSHEGFYRVIYKSKKRANPAKVDITAYCQRKDEPGNKLKIHSLQEQIADLQKRVDKLGKSSTTLTHANQVLTRDIESARAGLLSSAEELIKKVEQTTKSLKDCNEKMTEYESSIHLLRETGTKCLLEFKKGLSLYVVVSELCEYLEFPSSIVDSFAKSLVKFNKEVKEYEGLFSGLSTKVEASNNDNMNGTKRLVDSITGAPITHPVSVSHHGINYYFELSTLINQFGPSPTIDSVYRHTLPNGNKIRIQYLKWNDSPELKSIIESSSGSTSSLSKGSTPNKMKSYLSMQENELIVAEKEVEDVIRKLQLELEGKQVELQRIRSALSMHKSGDTVLPPSFGSPISQSGHLEPVKKGRKQRESIVALDSLASSSTPVTPNTNK